MLFFRENSLGSLSFKEGLGWFLHEGICTQMVLSVVQFVSGSYEPGCTQDREWIHSPSSIRKDVAKGQSFLTIMKRNWKGRGGVGIESQRNCGASCTKKLLTITLVCNIIITLTRHLPWILILSFNPPSSKKHMQPDNVSHFWTFFCCHFNNRRPQLMYFITFSASRLWNGERFSIVFKVISDGIAKLDDWVKNFALNSI